MVFYPCPTAHKIRTRACIRSSLALGRVSNKWTGFSCATKNTRSPPRAAESTWDLRLSAASWQTATVVLYHWFSSRLHPTQVFSANASRRNGTRSMGSRKIIFQQFMTGRIVMRFEFFRKSRTFRPSHARRMCARTAALNPFTVWRHCLPIMQSIVFLTRLLCANTTRTWWLGICALRRIHPSTFYHASRNNSDVTTRWKVRRLAN